MSNKIPISVLIPVKNEANNLPACLESVARAEEVFVVDSQSQDRTQEIAESYGAKVVQFSFNGHWPKKKNWSLENLHFGHEWILIVDGDERITPELWNEIQIAIQQPSYEGYYINRKVFFLGKWLRHGGRYPDWNLRLFKHQQGRYEMLTNEEILNDSDNEVHEHVILKGKVGYLKNDIIHEDFRDLYQWLARHNSYSNWEARIHLKLLNHQDKDNTIGAKFWGHPVQRKRWLKSIWVRLPFRAALRFFVSYFLQLGFLDGRVGYIYAKLQSQHEFNIAVKLYELRHCRGQLNPTSSPQIHPNSTPQLTYSK